MYKFFAFKYYIIYIDLSNYINYVIKGLFIQSGKSKNPGSKRPGALYIYCTAGINPDARSFASNPPPR